MLVRLYFSGLRFSANSASEQPAAPAVLAEECGNSAYELIQYLNAMCCACSCVGHTPVWRALA